MRLALFAYNFPHRKTQDFLVQLVALGHEIAVVLAADPVHLNIPAGTVRTKLRHRGMAHPAEISRALGLRYEVVEHNGPQAAEVLRECDVELAVIAGARILKGPVVDVPRRGIINFHPGQIPASRGLDALLWSVYRDIELGVTAHIIDQRVDAGTIVHYQPLPLYRDDTLVDLGERLIEIQTDMLAPAIQAVEEGRTQQIAIPKEPINRKMPPDLEQTIAGLLPDYLARRVSGS